jgi:hypothetical protein
MQLRRESPLQVPPLDQARAHEAWRRRMLIDGTWRDLLAEHGQRQLGPLRARLVGEWDTSANLFSSVLEQTSTMYREVPEQQGEDKASVDLLRRSFDEGGWWEMAADHQRYVKGINESLVYVGWDDEMAHPTFEIVTPDQCTIDHAPSNKRRPMTIWRAQQRPVPGSVTQELAWFWDRWSIAGGVGSYQVWSSDRKRDMTTSFFDPALWEGPKYRYRDELGRPVLPFVLYHGRGGSQLWTPFQRAEVVFGTLQVGVLWTAANHGMLRASWDQRVLLNGRVRGGATQEVGQRTIRKLTPDPTFILEVESTGGESASIGAWGASIDIEKAEAFCRKYEARLAVHFGLSPADVQIESFNPSSGASITVSRKGVREIAVRDRLFFAKGDALLAEVVAAVNRGWGRACSARTYRLRYPGVELTPEERASVIAYVEKEMDRGLMDEPAAYQELHPGTSVEDAQADLRMMEMRRLQAQVVADVTGTAPAVGAPEDIQATALNGAQVQAAQGIVMSVAAGQLPRESGIGMLIEFFQLTPQAAEKVMGPVGRGFTPALPPGAAPVPAPGGVVPPAVA